MMQNKYEIICRWKTVLILPAYLCHYYFGMPLLFEMQIEDALEREGILIPYQKEDSRDKTTGTTLLFFSNSLVRCTCNQRIINRDHVRT